MHAVPVLARKREKSRERREVVKEPAKKNAFHEELGKKVRARRAASLLTHPKALLMMKMNYVKEKGSQLKDSARQYVNKGKDFSEKIANLRHSVYLFSHWWGGSWFTLYSSLVSSGYSKYLFCGKVLGKSLYDSAMGLNRFIPVRHPAGNEVAQCLVCVSIVTKSL